MRGTLSRISRRPPLHVGAGNQTKELLMAKFLFVLTTGTENPSKGVRCMQLAAVAKEEGHLVNVFLTDDEVMYGKQGMTDNIVATTGDDMNTHLEKLTRADVPFYI